MHIHMGDAQVFFPDHFIVIENNIQIQRPGSPVHGPLPARFRLDPVQLPEQLPGCKERFQLQAAVQKIILVRHPVGRRLDQVRDRFHRTPSDLSQLIHCFSDIVLSPTHVGSQGDICCMFSTQDLHAHRFERQTDRRPGFLDLQTDLLKAFVFEQQFLRQMLRRALQQFVGVLLQIQFHKRAHFPVMDGFRQVVFKPGFSRIRIKVGRDHKLLPKCILLWKYAVISKYFQIFDSDSVHVFFLHYRLPACISVSAIRMARLFFSTS